MNSMKLVIPLHFISWKKTPNDAVTPQRQSQFTPKMKANAVPRLLSSLVWIDQYNECNRVTSFMEFKINMLSQRAALVTIVPIFVTKTHPHKNSSINVLEKNGWFQWQTGGRINNVSQENASHNFFIEKLFYN